VRLLKNTIFTAILFSASATSAIAAPPPRAIPVTETTHGIALTDEYRWMEDSSNAAEMIAWVKAEASDARKALEALPERAAFAAKLKEVSSELTRRGAIMIAGDTTIFRLQEPTDKTAKLVVRQGERERILFDPNGAQANIAMGTVSISPDGKMVAIHTSTGGSEIGNIQIYDSATGDKVGAPFENIWSEFDVNWLGGDLISYTSLAPKGETADPLLGMRAYVKRLGDAGPGKLLMGPGGIGPKIAAKEFPRIVDMGVGQWALASASGARADTPFWVGRTAGLLGGETKWHQVATLEDRIDSVALFDDHLLVLSQKTNGAGSILARPLSDDGIGTPVSVFEGNDRLIINGLAAAKDGVYIAALTDGAARVFFSKDGTKFDEVKLPFAGGEAAAFRAREDGKGILFAHSGWLENGRTIAIENGKPSVIPIASDSWAGAKAFTVDNLQAKSADGTMVPLVVVRPGGAIPKGGMPTILQGYGGYGRSTANPGYRRDSMAWTARGGAMAYCGTRGGGERGRSWHEGGRGANKPNGHADFIACAETLKAKGYAPSKGVVGTGTSMGGALVPPAVLKRPDLFAGMVPRVGVVNATRMGVAPNGANQFDEMGDPATADGFKALVGMDPYQMLPAAKAIPPTLITIGLNDNRVAPWMSAKFAARAKAKFGDKQQIWLCADDDSGHGIGTAEDARVAEAADMMAWAWAVSQ
jgi:prolyl oligopeptidase